jgi:hypothetical protein
MDIDAIIKAAALTKAALVRDFSFVTTKEIPHYCNPQYMEREALIGDSLYALDQIPAMLTNPDTAEKALYLLGGAHAVLWSCGAMTKKEIENINREAAGMERVP